MKRLFLVLLMVSLFAAACGGEETPPTAVVSTTEVETAVSEPTAIPPTEAPPTAVPPTEIPPTELPPTPETAVEPTAVQTSEAAGAGEAGTTAGSTACDHPYLPIRTGATWTYTQGPDTIVWEVLEVRGDESEATAVMQITTGEIVLDYEWACTAGTGIAAFDFGSLSSGPLGVEVSIERVNAEGQFILPADQLQPGITWENQIENIFRFTQDVSGEQLEVTGNISVSRLNTVLNTNSVTFDGTTVDGIQIEQSDAMEIVMDMLGSSTTQTVDMTLTYTLGQGIGIIRQDSAADFSGDVEPMELVSYSIPSK